MPRIDTGLWLAALALIAAPLAAQDASDPQPADITISEEYTESDARGQAIDLLDDGDRILDVQMGREPIAIDYIDETLTMTYLDPVRVALELDGTDPERVQLHINGKRIPEERVLRSKNGLSILSQDGETVATLELHDAHRLLHVLDPEARPRPVIGVHLLPVGETLAAQLGLGEHGGVIISDVTENYPAAQAGLRKHDVVTHINGQPVADTDAFQKAIQGQKPGTNVLVQFRRAGQALHLNIAVGDRNKLEGRDPRSENPLLLEPGRFVLGRLLGETGEPLPQATVESAPIEVPLLHYAPRSESRITWTPAAPDANAGLQQQIDSLTTQVEELKQLIQQLIESRERLPVTPR